MNRKYIEDHKKSIYLFLLVFISYALVYMTKNCYSAAMTSIVAEGIMTKSQTGFIAAMFYLVYAPFQIIGGILSDKYDPGKLILTGVIGAGAANLLVYFFSTNYIAMTIIWS
ncbi:MAG: MFS transporter, partial [Clostridia bacterium]|nr:MFS transporter [Clostridia bacterium]